MNNKTSVVTAQEYFPADTDAADIGELYKKAKTSLVENVRFLAECGHRLVKKKSELAHGEWLPWLRANADVLGFDSDSTARRLMALANRALTHDLEPSQALAISRKVWGNKDTAHVSHNSGDNEWYTPPEYIEAARGAMGGIDLDPASSDTANEVVQASHFYTQNDNGLTKQWAGKVWLNPPYAQPHIAHFAEAVAEKYERGEIEAACVLVNNATETDWCQRMLQSSAAICLLNGRVKFLDEQLQPAGAPLQGQVVIYFGKDVGSFSANFGSLGVIFLNG